MNSLKLDGYHAKFNTSGKRISFWKILELAGGAEFYESNPDQLRQEFKNLWIIFQDFARNKELDLASNFEGGSICTFHLDYTRNCP
jgi:hypothetical protein